MIKHLNKLLGIPGEERTTPSITANDRDEIKFLNTSAANYYLEELIKGAQERIIIISPFLKFNDRIKELLEDKDRLKIDIRIIYGKSSLAPKEENWLSSLQFIRTSFCKNLHAKCYLSENCAIITSMNLYDFSQVNNNEMGLFIPKSSQAQMYSEIYEESQRLIRVSDEVTLTAKTVTSAQQSAPANGTTIEAIEAIEKLTTSKLAKRHQVKTTDLLVTLEKSGYLESVSGKQHLTEKGKLAGAEFKYSKSFGAYFIWPVDLKI